MSGSEKPSWKKWWNGEKKNKNKKTVSVIRPQSRTSFDQNQSLGRHSVFSFSLARGLCHFCGSPSSLFSCVDHRWVSYCVLSLPSSSSSSFLSLSDREISLRRCASAINRIPYFDLTLLAHSPDRILSALPLPSPPPCSATMGGARNISHGRGGAGMFSTISFTSFSLPNSKINSFF